MVGPGHRQAALAPQNLPRRLALATMAGMASQGRIEQLDAEHRQARVRRHRSLLAHWVARWVRAPRPATVEPVPPIEPAQLGVTFAGHASVLLRYQGAQLMTDPMLGRWVGPVRRAVEPGVSLTDLAELDAVIISSRHRDHLHLPTLAALPRHATIVLPPGGHPAVSRLGFARVVELAPGAAVTAGTATITAVALARGDGGQAYRITGPGPSALFMGDGGYGGDFVDLGRVEPPDLALLPIGGYAPRSFRDRHSSPLDALAAFEDLRARLFIPIRHGAFALSYEHVDEPRRWLAELVHARGLERHVCPLHPGQSEVLVAPSAPHADDAGRGSRSVSGVITVPVEAAAAVDEVTDQVPAPALDWPPPARVLSELSARTRLRLAGPLA